MHPNDTDPAAFTVISEEDAEKIVSRVHQLASDASSIADSIPIDCGDPQGLMLKGLLCSVAGVLIAGDFDSLQRAFLQMTAVSQATVDSMKGTAN